MPESSLLPPELLHALRPDANAELPKVRQLYLALYSAIERGELVLDGVLPASRLLARQLGVGRNTVISVYEQLTAEGLLKADGRRGTRVARKVSRPTRAVPSSWPLSKRSAGLVSHASPHRALAPGEPDTTLFPQAQWRKALGRAAALDSSRLGYRTQALADTRKAIARYLATYRSLCVEPEQIVITASTRQSLTLAATLFADSGEQAWVECPGYLGAVDAFRLQGLDVRPCPLDGQGLTIPDLAGSRKPEPRLIYLTPCFQYPCGVTLGTERRDQLLALSRQHGSILFEDDYDSEFRDDTVPRPALAAEADGARVLHAGTFSKILFPAVRVGWMVVPAGCAERAHHGLRAIGGGNNTVAQAAIRELLDNGTIARHLRHARQVYAQRRRALLDALSGCNLFVPLEANVGSLSLVLPLMQTVPLPAMCRALDVAAIGAQPIERLQWNQSQPRRCRALVLGLGNVQTLAVPSTVARLIDAVRSVASP